jgi:translation elongation factor EF-4
LIVAARHSQALAADSKFLARNRSASCEKEEGKKRMRQFGKVEIPQEAFVAALKMDED